ncbi:MAG: 30S ribosomal protein S8 [Candidatus Euphemobacter frigidus]|nr:30S ribosomal protein S8 [Candidatus Euphemobacter frigidus]MDP8276190.1 30S ribosomal protein S8 [Candidatus Euphemobacter frigidus]
MTMTDPIADLLTRIRNANIRGLGTVDIPASGLKKEIVRILEEEKFIKNSKFMEDGRQGMLRVYLRYGPARARVIRNLQRISRPGRRIYVRKDEIPHPKGGLGVAIISTSKGVFTDKQASRAGMGGEIICYVW